MYSHHRSIVVYEGTLFIENTTIESSAFAILTFPDTILFEAKQILIVNCGKAYSNAIGVYGSYDTISNAPLLLAGQVNIIENSKFSYFDKW